MGRSAGAQWAGAILVLCLVVFAYPMVACFELGTDWYVQTFVGRWMLCGLLVLPLFLGAFFWQARKEPNHTLMCLLNFLPCSVFIIIGMVVAFECGRVADKIGSTDCMRADSVQVLLAEEKAASDFLVGCRQDTPIFQHILIQSCPGYADALEESADRKWAWTTMRTMEENLYCAGVC